MVFIGEDWQTEEGEKKTAEGGERKTGGADKKTGGGEKKTGGGEKKKTGGGEKKTGRRRSHVEVQSDLVIHWLLIMHLTYISIYSEDLK